MPDVVHTERTVTVAAPPARVWEVVSDVEGWPEWHPACDEVRLLDPGPLRVGSRAVVRQPRLPAATWEVTELDEGRSFTWVTRAPGSVTTGGHHVTPTGDGATLTLELDQAGPLGTVVGLALRGLVGRYVGFEAEGIKARSESG